MRAAVLPLIEALEHGESVDANTLTLVGLLIEKSSRRPGSADLYADLLPASLRGVELTDREVTDLALPLVAAVESGSLSSHLRGSAIAALGKAVGNDDALKGLLSIASSTQLPNDDLRQLLISLENLLNRETRLRPEVMDLLERSRLKRFLEAIDHRAIPEADVVARRILSKLRGPG